MAKPLRVGIAGLIHDHVWWNVDAFVRARRTRIVAVADRNRPLLERLKAIVPDVAVYRDPVRMLEREDLGILLACTTNAGTAEIVEEAARRGVHAVTEKPMAARLAQADRMLRAARRHGVKLMVNWPPLWDPKLWHMAELVRKGAIGRLYQIRWRCAHQGPKEIGCTPYFYRWLYDARRNGAGALIDYCCYGAALCRWLQGRPRAVTGLRGRLVKGDIRVDDNAVLLLKYPKAIGLCEASWTQVGEIPSGIVASGSEGAIAVEHARMRLADAKHPQGRPIRPRALRGWRANLGDYFARVIREDLEIEGMGNPEIARDAQEILEAGLISADTGRAVRLPLRRRLPA